MQTSQGKNTSSSKQNRSGSPAPLIEIERDFHAPVSRVFNAFKTPEAIRAWWWPNGLEVDQVEIDFREGGSYFITMTKSPMGNGGMTGRFEEIDENERIVMTDRFADEQGRAISAKEAKMPGDWPEVIYITFDFDSSGDHKTRLRFTQDGIPTEMQKDCIQGWNEMFDKLERYLGNHPRS